MEHVQVVGRQLVPAALDFGLSYDVNANSVRFTVPMQRDPVFDAEGVAYSVYWIAPNGLTGTDPLILTEEAGALTGDWTPAPEALVFKGVLRAEIQVMDGEALLWHSLPLRLTLAQSLEDEGLSAVVVPKYKEVTVAVEALPEGSDPTGTVTQDKDSIDFQFGIPAAKGETGTAATFEIVQVETVSPGTPAQAVEMPGSTPQGRLYKLLITQGEKGDAATFAILDVVTGEPGTQASIAEAEGSTPQNRRYVLTVPRGDVGPQGIQGLQGIQGIVGPRGLTGFSPIHFGEEYPNDEVAVLVNPNENGLYIEDLPAKDGQTLGNRFAEIKGYRDETEAAREGAEQAETAAQRAQAETEAALDETKLAASQIEDLITSNISNDYGSIAETADKTIDWGTIV